jgi:hypothetical protein
MSNQKNKASICTILDRPTGDSAEGLTALHPIGTLLMNEIGSCGQATHSPGACPSRANCLGGFDGC